MVDWVLSDNMTNICRLCLQTDDFIVDIFHRLDPNPHKQPLPDRIYDLFQVKVGKSDGLPTNICHRCLYFTESFTDFRNNVRKCEARLQSYIASIGILGSVRIRSSKNGIKTEEFDDNFDDIEHYGSILPDENSQVTIVDPNLDYESSNESFSMDSENEYTIQLPQLTDDRKEENGHHFTNTDGIDNPEGLKNVFLCQYCDMAFTAQIECAEHEIRHDAANPHSCNYCPFRCASRQTVIAHIKELHDNERPYVCVQCNKGFGRRSDLKKHTIVHTGIRPFTCPVCNKNFSRNTNLTKHLRIHTGLKPHVCQKCPRSFTTTADLLRHQRVHSDYKPFQCQKCSSAFTRKDKLQHHEKMHLKKEKHSAVSSQATADSRGTSNDADGFDTENMVIALDPFSDMNQEHLDHSHELHHTDLKHHQKSFSSFKETNSRNHSLVEHRSYDGCENGSRSMDHSDDRGHLCLICNKSFLRKRELERHSVIHTGIKPFACKVCNKRFNRKDKVVRHERIHCEERLFCGFCKLGFLKQEALDAHIKTHEIEKITEEQKRPQQMELLSFHNSLKDVFRPQLNFYSEIKTEASEH